jgi:hypothetical protein
MVKKGSTIKNDPFALVVPEPEPTEALDFGPATEQGGAAARGRTGGNKKEKITVHLTHDLIERVKNAAYWNPRLTIAGIAESGIVRVIEQVEEENGGPYPPRAAELKGGRPIGATVPRETP